MSGCTAHASVRLSVPMTAVWPTVYTGCFTHHIHPDATYQDCARQTSVGCVQKELYGQCVI